MHFEFCEMGQIVTHGTRNVVIALKNMCVVILRNMEFNENEPHDDTPIISVYIRQIIA